MKQFSIVVVFAILGGVFSGDGYPSELPRCKAGDTSCLNDVITTIVAQNPKGHQGLNLIPYDPLHIKTLNIEQDPKSPVNIQLKFSDVDLIGIGSAKIYKTIGFAKDPETSQFEVHAKIPKLQLVGPYTIKGQILILPIVGSGKSSFTFEDVDISLKFTPKVEEKNGQKFVQATKLKFDMKPNKMISNFENLFNGDKALTDNMNLFLNENWKEIFGELKGAITKAIGEILQKVMNGPFGKIPYNDLYLPE